MGRGSDTGGYGGGRPQNDALPPQKRYVITETLGTDPTRPADFEPTERAGRPEEWGELPAYLQHLQRRGTDVDIPERYRKLFDAYVKRVKPTATSRSPSGSKR